MDKWLSFYGLEESWFSSKSCANTSFEIAQQSALWRELKGMLIGEKAAITAFVKKAGGFKSRRIVLAGAGSSAYAGDAAALMAGKSLGVKAEGIPTTDIVSSPNSVLFKDIPTLLVSFGRTGNSPESACTVEYARKAIKDLYEIAIVCDGDSKLAKLSEGRGRSMTLVMPMGSCDKGFAMTSSFTCMLLTCCAVLSIENGAVYDAFLEDIERLADAADKAERSFVDAARELAAAGYDRLIVLGSGCLKPLAREASLKSMELTMGEVNASSDGAMAFRHGPKAAIKDGTVTVHFISPDLFTSFYDMDLLDEINRQKKGNKVIAISPEKLSIAVDKNIVTPISTYGPGMEVCQGIMYLFFCQILAMFKSLSLGFATDNPVTTGELSRTVSGVKLYDLQR